MKSGDGPHNARTAPMSNPLLGQHHLGGRQSFPTEPFTAIKKHRLQANLRSYSSSANPTETSSSDCSIDVRLDVPENRHGSKFLRDKSMVDLSAAVKGSSSGRPTAQFSPSFIHSGKLGTASRTLSDSDGVFDLMDFQESSEKEELLNLEEVQDPRKPKSSISGFPPLRHPVDHRTSLASSDGDSQKSDRNSFSTICDSVLEDVRPTNLISKRIPVGNLIPVVNSFHLSREELQPAKLTILEEGPEHSLELSLFDVLEFISESLLDVKTWIHEVPNDCRKRIGQCDAFLSYLSAKLYKDRELLVGSELFSFVLWFVLKDCNSPDEYGLEHLVKSFGECRNRSWATDWSRITISQVLQDLPPSINCQNKSCLSRSAAPSVTSEESVDVVKRQRHKLKATRSAPLPPKSRLSQSRSGLLMDASASRPMVVHSLSIDSLTGALANTQQRKVNPSASLLNLGTSGPLGVGGKATEIETDSAPKIPPAEELNFLLSKNIPVRPSLSKTSRVTGVSVKRDLTEVDHRVRTPLSDACDILYKTGKRNLRRMLDYALTDFFTQSPSLTCCLISASGPLLVHEALFGAQCANWTTVRWNGRKRAAGGNILIIDLRSEGVSSIGLWTVIEFIYTGIFTVTVENVFEAQRAADYFGVSVITDACLRLLNCLTSPKMVCYTIESLRRLHKESHPLWTLALGRLVVCFDECRNDKIMVRWPLEVILPILEQPELSTQDEVNVYNLAVHWIEADFARRRILVPQIMNTVRFATMTGDTLLTISSHARILDGHPNLRQEIADLHLKIRMEDSGFEIPPEMDWSIPRRTRRVPNAACAFTQSGRDLNVLMLYFCPRVMEFAMAKDKQVEDLIQMTQRYMAVCSKFLLITESGKFAGQWIYCGFSKKETWEMALERKKLLRTRDPCDQSSVDMDPIVKPPVLGRRHPDVFDEEDDDSTDVETNDLRDLEPGTKLPSIMRFLELDATARSTPAPPVVATLSQSQESFLSSASIVKPSGVLSPSPTLVPDLIGKVTRHLEELRRNSSYPTAGGDSSIPQMLIKMNGSISPLSVTKAIMSTGQPIVGSTAFPLRNNVGSIAGGKRATSAERRALFKSESTTSITFESDSKSQDSVHAEIQHEKKWYVELAEKMNVFVTGDSVSDRGHISPPASRSSFCQQPEDYFN